MANNELSSTRTFSPDYYAACSSNSIKRSTRWFCNRSISPINVSPKNYQDNTVTSSMSNESLELKEVPEVEFLPPQYSSDSDSPGGLDSDADPEYKPSSSSSIISSSSSQSLNDELETEIRYQGDVLQGSRSSSSVSKNGATKLTSRTKKNQNFCCFCETFVYNFARHIIRNHQSETATQRILAEPAGSKKRKELFNALRKKGNYLDNCEVGKPMRKHKDTKYLPCSECLGFYSSKNLWKHRKNCCKNLSSRPQVEAQNFLLRHLKIDSQLRNTVFPRMRADEISLIAKKDFLICAFAARYIKVHREKHFINVASRKMREMAKIVIEMKSMVPAVKNLFDSLRPQYYDNLVTATRNIARYDNVKEYYGAPTLALNMGTSLKQCCDIAVLHVLKRKNIPQTVETASVEADIKTLVNLIEAHWRFDVSSQASQDLNIKRWNKVTIVPLASDLKLLKEYLIKVANNSIIALNKNSNDQKGYTNLLETVFCRVVLLNRKRPGELQRFPLHTYVATLDAESTTYEEFSEAVSETEKILMRNFKRIVIRGKRGRGVPVLFSKDVQDHLQILLKYRDGIMKKQNPYLFGNPLVSEPITGYKILSKYAHACGAKNPSSITCTKLRKHLATLAQLFNMTENDLEQLATFMGHTLSVHRSAYRLPDDIYQTAKISKLLLLMEKGEAGQFKGKGLDEINLDLEEDLMNIDTNSDVEEQLEQQVEYENIVEGNKEKEDCHSNALINKKRILVPWSDEQKKTVCNFFKTHIRKKQPPKKVECEELKKLHPQLLSNKDWLKIKVFVQNKYTKS